MTLVASGSFSAAAIPRIGYDFLRSGVVLCARCVLPQPCPVRCSDGVFREWATFATSDPG
jgi:hypothetical protein